MAMFRQLTMLESKYTRMKRKEMKILIVVLLISCIAAGAQTMDCGNVTLKIGMLKARAVQALNDDGYMFLAGEDGGLQNKTYSGLQTVFNKSAENSCAVVFANGKLSYVSRHWTKGIKNDVDAIGKTVDAIQGITEIQKHSLCTVFPYRGTTPTSSQKSVSITCGAHTITLSQSFVEESAPSNGLRVYDIEESIGDMLLGRDARQ